MSRIRRENFSRVRALRSSRSLHEERRKRESRNRTSAAVLSDQDIWHEIRQGNICIEPLKTRNLTSSSYYVTIGTQYYTFIESGDYLNPWHKTRIQRHWEGPYKAVTIDQEIFQKCGVPIGKKVIIVPGNTTILAHTQEFIGALNFIAAEMRGCKASRTVD